MMTGREDGKFQIEIESAQQVNSFTLYRSCLKTH